VINTGGLSPELGAEGPSPPKEGQITLQDWVS
jgi:hypothetical protein